MDNYARLVIGRLTSERDALRRVVRAWDAWSDACVTKQGPVAASAELELARRALAELDAKRIGSGA